MANNTIPGIQKEAFDWMEKFRESHPEIYFQLRKKENNGHSIENGYFFSGNDRYVSVGLTTTTLTRSVHSIAVIFDVQKGKDSPSIRSFLERRNYLIRWGGIMFTTNRLPQTRN